MRAAEETARQHVRIIILDLPRSSDEAMPICAARQAKLSPLPHALSTQQQTHSPLRVERPAARVDEVADAEPLGSPRLAPLVVVVLVLVMMVMMSLAFALLILARLKQAGTRGNTKSGTHYVFAYWADGVIYRPA
jgi:hypothetical protein